MKQTYWHPFHEEDMVLSTNGSTGLVFIGRELFFLGSKQKAIDYFNKEVARVEFVYAMIRIRYGKPVL